MTNPFRAVNQYHHGILDREVAVELLSSFSQNTEVLEIPQNVPVMDDGKEMDSTFEEFFHRELKRLNIPLPRKQYKVSFPNATVDFVWPEEKIALYVDGEFYHSGNRIKADKMIRMALKSSGWKVVVVTDDDWNDLGLRALKFKELLDLLA